MSLPVPGQRWICESEPTLGLGTVLSADNRRITIVFLASGDTRTYSLSSAPIKRVQFKPGEMVDSHEQWTLRIESTKEEAGLITYFGQRDDQQAVLHESELSNFMQFSQPLDRLFASQIDSNKWFSLRQQALKQKHALLESDTFGLSGARTSLIPHQLYVAQDVAKRFAPRVLLADEVGLGKTIEAGLILHQQILTERVQRVLIIVPETLIHQWLVEMLRRFNLHFNIYDEERCIADEESGNLQNPFENEQLILCSLGFLSGNEQRFEQVSTVDWDLLIIDEAHHLEWTPQVASREYLLVEKLALATKGLILITATPEQVGKTGHFARLRLLDPSRFRDLEQFLLEEQQYQPIAEFLETLIALDAPKVVKLIALPGLQDDVELNALFAQLNSLIADDSAWLERREKIIRHLLDRHGTGRVLFRNTRSSIQGFPGREIHSYPLELPEIYAQSLADAQESGISSTQHLLSIELLYQSLRQKGVHWASFDPRLPWLAHKLKQLKPLKVLVLTSNAQTAKDIEKYLRTKEGIHCAVFHEGMSIIERDRAAAFFADVDTGSQALICSEIGSEGRNFQFSHHLIMFDLPYNPDLLEQRIGRLDRIGQTKTINLHIPYLQKTAQETLFRWYKEGLNAFAGPCSAGQTVFRETKNSLFDALHFVDEYEQGIEELIASTQAITQQISDKLEHGRDRLLELQSHHPVLAEQIAADIEDFNNEKGLLQFVNRVFNCYGIEFEELDATRFLIKPSEAMQLSSFPNLPDDGMTVTVHRPTALINEDVNYLSWEHPLVQSSIDLLLTQEMGNTSLVAIKSLNFEPGTMLLESVFSLEFPGLKSYVRRYIPATVIRIVITHSGADVSAQISMEEIDAAALKVDKLTAIKIVKQQTEAIQRLATQSQEMAGQQAVMVKQNVTANALLKIGEEKSRLIALARINPSVRKEEIEFFDKIEEDIQQSSSLSKIRLDALRIIVTT